MEEQDDMELHGRQRRTESLDDRRAALISDLYQRAMRGDVTAATAYLDATQAQQEQVIEVLKGMLEEMSTEYCERCRPLWNGFIERFLRKVM
jgi:hypothetical protein